MKPVFDLKPEAGDNLRDQLLGYVGRTNDAAIRNNTTPLPEICWNHDLRDRERIVHMDQIGTGGTVS